MFQALPDGGLMERFRGQRLECSSWADGLAARLEHAPGRWRPWAPNWMLLNRDGSATDAGASAFVDAIPAGIRAQAAQFPQRQWLALDALRHVPGFADFLAQEVGTSGLSFVLLCWEASHAQYRPSTERHGLARAIMMDRRASVLRRLTDAPFSERHVRLLSRVPLNEVDKDLVWDLLDAAGDGVVAQELAAAPLLRRSLLRGIREVPVWLHVPALLRLMVSGAASPGSVREVTAPLQQADDALRARIRASLATASTWPEAVRLAERWKRTLRAAIAFPPPPFPGTPRLRFIRDGLDLEDEGREMSHCVAGYADRARAGTCAFYRWLGPERATVQLSRTPEGWRLSEHLGVGNRALSAATVEAIRQEVAAQLAGRPAPEALPIDTYVAGAAYHQAIKVMDHLRPGQPLVLRREPTNPYDAFAIEVLTEAGDKLGYVPRVHNRQPAAMLDAGEALQAWVVRLREDLDIRIRLGRRLRAAA